MSNRLQKGFVLRNDGFWWAPPIDPNDDFDYFADFTDLLNDGEVIDEILVCSATNITVYGYTIDPNTQKKVYLRLKDGVNKKIGSVRVYVRSGQNKIDRTFKIEIVQL